MADETVTIETLQARVDALEELNAGLEKELAKTKAERDKAPKPPKVAQAPKSAEGRKLGALKPPKNDEEAAARKAAVAEAIASGPTQVVFSDGQREIRELAPLNVHGEAWRHAPGAHVLDHEPLLEPGDCQRETLELKGFALLDAEGRQVGYHPLPEPVTIRRNSRVQLARNTIRF